MAAGDTVRAARLAADLGWLWERTDGFLLRSIGWRSSSLTEIQMHRSILGHVPFR